MSDFVLADPAGWEYDLHSVYSAWIGYFQVQNIPWYERSWGHVFSSFGGFLEFEWPAIVVTDAFTGKAHIVTRLSSIEAFIKMVKTRFGEVLQLPPNLVTVTPFETTSRPLRRVTDQASYKKLHISLTSVALSAFKTRVRDGDPAAVEEVWKKKDKTFLALDFEWSERNEKSILEWGYAAVRCSYLDAQGYWPPDPDANYRKGHFIVSEYTDKVINKYCPNHPWQYAFGDSQIVSKTHVPQILEAVISSLVSPDSDSSSNDLVIVGHGIAGDLKRIEDLKIKLPRNVFVIDLSLYERKLFQAGSRGEMIVPKTGKPRASSSTLSLENLLRSLPTTFIPSPNAPPPSQHHHHRMVKINSLPGCVLHNSGNDAFLALFAFQKLLDPDHTPMPSIKKRIAGSPSHGAPSGMFPPGQIAMPPVQMTGMGMPMYGQMFTPVSPGGPLGNGFNFCPSPSLPFVQTPPAVPGAHMGIIPPRAPGHGGLLTPDYSGNGGSAGGGGGVGGGSGNQHERPGSMSSRRSRTWSGLSPLNPGAASGNRLSSSFA